MPKLTKTQIYIISAIIVGVIVYFMFFHKKKTAVTPVKPATTPSESNYYGDNWGWKQGPQAVSPAQTLAMVSANVNNSVAGTMESNYQQDELTGGRPNFESNYSAAMNKAGSATNFLGY